MQSNKAQKPTISLRLTREMLETVDDLTVRGGMRSRTDFVERALKAYIQEIRETRLIRVRHWTQARARTAILKFLRHKPSALVSEIAETLGMDFDTAFSAVDSLLQEGKVDRAA